MNARITCGIPATRAARAAVVAASILTLVTARGTAAADSQAVVGPAVAPHASGYIVTDESEPTPIRAILPGDGENRVVTIDRDDGAEEEGVDESGSGETLLVGLEDHGTCRSCAGQGCRKCRDTNRWVDRIFRNVEPRLIGQVDAIFLWQGAIPSRSLYVADAAPYPTVLNADQAQTPVSTGARYTLQMNLDCTYAFEGSYFSVYGFEGEHSTPHSDSGYGMNNLAGLTYGDIDWARLRTGGSIQSAEFNWRRKTRTPITWLAGFRWVEWNEGMTIIDRYDGLDGLAFDRIDTRTGNDMYGGQVGADVMLWNRGHDVKVNGVGKAGIFYNQAYSRTKVPTDFFPLDGDAAADQTAFFGEVGANASFKLTHWLSWRLGYSLYWLSGVATAADQLDLVGQNPPLERPRINTNGSVLLHGATTGLEARW